MLYILEMKGNDGSAWMANDREEMLSRIDKRRHAMMEDPSLCLPLREQYALFNQYKESEYWEREYWAVTWLKMAYNLKSVIIKEDKEAAKLALGQHIFDSIYYSQHSPTMTPNSWYVIESDMERKLRVWTAESCSAILKEIQYQRQYIEQFKNAPVSTLDHENLNSMLQWLKSTKNLEDVCICCGMDETIKQLGELKFRGLLGAV